MKQKNNIIVSLLFGIIISSISIVQIFVDLKEIKGIRVADIIFDTFYAPVKRAKNIAYKNKKISYLINKLKEGEYISDVNYLETTLDTIEDLTRELKNKIVTINRFVSDSQNRKVYLTDSLLNVISDLKISIDRDSTVEKFTLLCDISNKIEKELKRGVFLGVKSIIIAFTKETFFNKEYLRKYEKELEDNSPLVKEGRKIFQLFRFLAFDDYGEKIIGSKRWLFYSPDVKYLYRPSVIDKRAKRVDFNDSAIEDNPVETILDFKAQLDREGIDLIVVIVPVKAGIYPQILNSKIKKEDKYSISPTSFIIDELKREKVKIVDLYDAFLDAKKDDIYFGDSLYLCKDTHWKSRGIRIAAKRVAEEIKKCPWFTEPNLKYNYIIDTIYVYREGDIVAMTNLLKVNFFSVKELYQLELTKCFQVVYSKDNNVETKKIYRDDFKNSRILLLGDSFSRIYQTDPPKGAGFIAHIAYELSEPLASIVSDGGASTIVREKLSRNRSILKGKKVIIWEFVERDLRFGEGGWKKIKIF